MADDDEQGSPIGRSLKGHTSGQAARRRWYFSHDHFESVREGHRQEAERHRAAAAAVSEEERARSVRARNKAKERTYLAELREYEEKRLEKEEARYLWADLRTDIKGRTGGINSKSVTEDYRELPRSVRTTEGGENIDNAAEYYGMGQDEFVRYVASTRDRYERLRSVKVEKPRRPELEKEPRRRLSAAESEARRTRRREIRELREMIRDGEKELGRGHPALAPLHESLAELRAEDKAA